MNLNLKMTVERSKRRSQFLSLVFITKCFNKNLLLRILKRICTSMAGVGLHQDILALEVYFFII